MPFRSLMGPLRHSGWWSFFLWTVISLVPFSIAAAEIRPPGFDPRPLRVHALVGGKVFIKPGVVLEQATIVIRNGLIEAVGEKITPPSDARIWLMNGLFIYSGFIDPYVLGAPAKEAASASSDAGDALDRLTSGRSQFFGVPPASTDPIQKRPGADITRIRPERRTAQTYSPDEKLLESLRQLGFTAGAFAPEKGIIKGTSVLVALSDGDPNDVIIRSDVFQHVAIAAQPSKRDAYPRSLMGTIAAIRQTFYDAQQDALDRADWDRQPAGRTRPPFNPATQALAPVLDKKIPVLFELEQPLMLARAAAIAQEFNLTFHLLATGQEWRRPDVVPENALLILPLDFPELPKISSEDDWEDVSLDQLRAWDWASENPSLLRNAGREFAFTSSKLSDRKQFRKNLQAAIDRGLSEKDALAALTTIPAKLCRVQARLGTIEPGKVANLTVVQGNYFEPDNKVRELWIDGRPEKVDFAPAKSTAAADHELKEKQDAKKKEEAQRKIAGRRVAQSPQKHRGPIAAPKTILIEHAVLWTCGPEGRIENGSLYIENGKIAKVSREPLLHSAGIADPPDLVIDASGRQITPGLIDAHSHAMILGDVNEATLPSTAMVRVGDVVNSETENIYGQLAGGLTTANLLHGSANPIGGQNCVIKLKEGARPEELIMPEAPPGIKFALGENVKQSNWGERFTTRFPQTRMGVRTFFANRFTAAQNYAKEWENYRQKGAGVPPRKDLELEALSEILQGKRRIHCHCYRQDEILSFLRLMEQFDVRVATLQHVLEGYKVADEIARHGAGASTFSDWWAYKFEVYDAIAYSGSLMRERGVVVSFNSDDADLARRLYLETAKAVKYGGTPEEEALKFVTLNPAKQLQIDSYVGSLEPGKEADFVLWSKSPLDSTTACLETWIEGKKYFDRNLAPKRASARQAERKALLEKARKLAATSETKSEPKAESQF